MTEEKALTAHWHEGSHIGCYVLHDRCPTCGGTKGESRFMGDWGYCTDDFHDREDG